MSREKCRFCDIISRNGCVHKLGLANIAAAAEALRGWLPKIINAIKPWLSSEDIDKGARWSTDVASRLEAAKAGIICLTPSNLHSDWILFEAGALSKTLQNTFVCPFLIGLEPSDVKPPLAQFQATKGQKDDVLKLLKTLNSALGDGALPEAHIDEAFDVWWPKLESQLKTLPPEESKAKTHRPDRELLEELLALVRSQIRSSDLVSGGTERLTPSAQSFPFLPSWHEIVVKEIADLFSKNGDRVESVGMQTERTSSGKPAYFRYQVNSGTGTHLIRLPAGISEEEAIARLTVQVNSADAEKHV